MSVTTIANLPRNGDGLRGLHPFKYAATSALLTFTINPTIDMTSVEIANPSIGNPIQLQLIGKNSTGVDAPLTPIVIPSNLTVRVNFAEHNKVSGADLTQVIDRGIITILKQDESAVAVAADVPNPFTVTGTFQNA